LRDHNKSLTNPTALQQRVLDACLAFYDAYREFLSVAETCAQKGWPDFKSELQNAFSSQRLVLDRDFLRLKHLAAHAPECLASLQSVWTISTRLEKDWQIAENNAIAEQNLEYRDLEAEIGRRIALTHDHGLKGSFAALNGDPEFIRATGKLHQEALEIDTRFFGK
jgi:hypothetical protein